MTPRPPATTDTPTRAASRGPALRVLVALAILAALVLLAVRLYALSWTGFSGKTLWDWLDLLFVPVVLAVGGWLLDRSEKHWEQRLADQRSATDRAIAADNQREATLQTYLERMAALLLSQKLREAPAEAEVRAIARSWTLTVLRRLDSERKVIVLRFLYETDLIKTGAAVVNLRGADLNGADLAGINLSHADLHRANLTGANLSEAYLRSADLRGATLTGANLRAAKLYGAYLQGADLRGADLTGAKVQNVSWQGADLREAQILPDQLADARSLRGLLLPDGTKHV